MAGESALPEDVLSQKDTKFIDTSDDDDVISRQPTSVSRASACDVSHDS